MERGLQGYYIPCTTSPEPFWAFVPRPLPPEPPLQIDAGLQDLSERANRALGRLDGITTLLPEPSLFLYLYIRKEALLSSQIEGTQSSFSDLLLYENEEAPGVPLDDVKFIEFSCKKAEAAIKHLEKSGALRTGLMVHVPATLFLYPLHHKMFRLA